MDSVAAEGRLTESSGRTSRSSAGRSSAFASVQSDPIEWPILHGLQPLAMRLLPSRTGFLPTGWLDFLQNGITAMSLAGGKGLNV